jgi:uncharacterized membrane protein YcaP (DUF421 family)
MGKRQLGEMQPFELVITLIIADLACIPMAEATVPLLHGIVPLLTLVVLHFLMSVLSRKSIRLRNFFNGNPVVVMDPNGIRYKALKALNITLDDLSEGLRNSEYFSFDEIAYAIIETNGKLSILPKSQMAPPKAQDMKVKTDEAHPSMILINDGKLIDNNIQTLGVQKAFIEELLNKNDMKSIKDVLVLTLNNLGVAYLQGKSGPSKTLNTSFKGD